MRKLIRRPFLSFSEFQKEIPFTQELPYWDFLENAVVLSDGTLVSGLKLQGVAIESWDADRINHLTQEWRSFLNSLADGTELGFMTEADSDFETLLSAHERERIEGISPNIRWLSETRLAALKEDARQERLLRTHIYLFIYRRYQPAKKKTFSSLKAFFSPPKRFLEVSREEHEAAVRELEQTTQAIASRLGGIGLGVTRFSADECSRLVYRVLNPSRARSEPTPKISTEHRSQEFQPEELSKAPGLTLPSPREQLAFSPLIQGYDTFFLDGLYHRIITLKTLPEATHSALVSRLTQLGFPHRGYFHIRVPEQSKELSSLQAKRRMAHSMSLSHGGRATDLESESKLHATEDLLRELINTAQKIFYFQASFCLYSADIEVLDLMTKAALSRLRELNGAEGLCETVAGFKVWKTMLPFGNTAMVREKRVKTDNLADFLPLYQAYDGAASKPVCLFQNRSQGLVAYDPFDGSRLPNFNALITGSSGAGKSFIANIVQGYQAIKRPLLFLVDVGGSYRKFCEFLGGQYIELGPARAGEKSPVINPFELPPGTTEPSPQKLKFLLAFFESVLSDEGEKRLPKLSRSLLEEALFQTYAKFAAKGAGSPTLSDFTAHLAASPEASLREFARMLYPWTGNRAYGRLLDGKNELKLESDVVVFDLKGLSSYPDLQAVMILIITDFILGRVEDRALVGRPKQIILDEAWELLKSPVASAFMEYLVRTVRKTGSGLTFITQGLEEIVASPIGSAILSNTATKVILLQRGDLEPTRKVLKLNDQEMALISSLRQSKGNYSEAFLMANEDRTVIRVCPSAIEYWLATSDAADNALLAERRKSEPDKSLAQHIFDLAAELPQGVAASRSTAERREDESNQKMAA